jgi:hypothetical protein
MEDANAIGMAECAYCGEVVPTIRYADHPEYRDGDDEADTPVYSPHERLFLGLPGRKVPCSGSAGVKADR